LHPILQVAVFVWHLFTLQWLVHVSIDLHFGLYISLLNECDPLFLDPILQVVVFVCLHFSAWCLYPSTCILVYISCLLNECDPLLFGLWFPSPSFGLWFPISSLIIFPLLLDSSSVRKILRVAPWSHELKLIYITYDGYFKVSLMFCFWHISGSNTCMTLAGHVEPWWI